MAITNPKLRFVEKAISKRSAAPSGRAAQARGAKNKKRSQKIIGFTAIKKSLSFAKMPLLSQ